MSYVNATASASALSGCNVTVALEAFWDRTTGMLCEIMITCNATKESEGYLTTLSLSYTIEQTSIWSPVLRGDVNHDGEVSIIDIVVMAQIYGGREGDHGWNPDADLARPHGIIDICDLVTCAYHYGET